MGRSRVTDDQLHEAARTAQNLQQLLRAVGMVGRGGNCAAHRARLVRIGVLDRRSQQQPRRPDPTEQELRAAAAESTSVAQVCRRLGVPPQGRPQRRVTELLLLAGVDTSRLRLLCPNCHALTDTWRGRNIGRRTVDPAPP